MMRLCFLDTNSLDCSDISFAALEFPSLQMHYWKQTSTQQILERIQDCEIVISNKVPLDLEVLEKAKQLKLICVAATGTNNVDLNAARKHKIQVCNVTNYATASVVQYVFSVMTSLNNRLAEHRASAFTDVWHSSHNFCVLDYPFQELEAKVLGIIGFGVLGQAVAAVAESFGMQVLIAERPVSRVEGKIIQQGKSENPIVKKIYPRTPINDLLRQSDFVSLHCPLDINTHHLMNAASFKQMKQTAVLINTARGGVVNELDLLAALQAGTIAAASLDVLETEPPAKNHPLLQYNMPTLIITPHIAWASRESRQRLVDQLGMNVRSYLDGQLRNRV